MNELSYLIDGSLITDLNKVYQVTDKFYRKIMTGFFQTQHMNLSTMNLPIHQQHLINMPITTIFLDDNMSVELVNHNLPNLTHLDLSFNYRKSDLSLLMISMGCPNLQNFHLSGINVSDGRIDSNDGTFIKLAKSCPKLRSLNLS